MPLELDRNLQTYIDQHSSLDDQLLLDVERATHLKTTAPRMLSGAMQGQILTLLTKMLQPKLIVEIGTFTGYSALCFVKGLAPDGKLITIDNDEETAIIAQHFFDRSTSRDQIDFRIGDAKTILPTINQKIDLVFIDADKEHYLDYYEMLIPKMTTGSVILADNVLWSGKIVQEAKDKKTAVLQAFNTAVKNDPRVENIILPIRDGIHLIRIL